MPLTAGATTYIVFRYDDFAGDAPGVRERDILRKQVWDAEQAVDRMFQKYGFSYTIAIIPNRNGVPLGADTEKVEFIRNAVSARRVEVAQHGLSHTNHTKANHRPGEFRERDYQSQFQDIKRGREILLSALGLNDIAVFVPPWNGWTNDTGRVVEELGFRIFSADCYNYYDSAEGLMIIPYTTGLRGLELLVDGRCLPDAGIVVVLYHPHDIVKYADRKNAYFGIDKFEKLLSSLSTSPGVSVETLGRLCNKCSDLTAQRFRLANKLNRYRAFWGKLLPLRLLPAVEPGLAYLSIQKYSQILRPWYYLTVAFIVGLIGVGFLFRFILKSRLSAKWRVRMDIFAAILSCISVLAELRLLQRGYHITGIRMVPALFAGGFLFGFFLDLAKKFLCRGSAPNRA
jgi:hypothetical protein